MKYCNRCLYPNTKPDLTFNDEGVCSACLAFDQRKDIDWNDRKRQFENLVVRMVSDNTNGYHCIVPVSGGKDSHFQVIKCLEYGLRPLAVTATTDHLSDIGRANLENISRLGVDHVTVTINGQLRDKLAKYALFNVGDISWVEHVSIFTIPVREAIQRQIKWIVWGENPQNEYGGPTEAQKATQLTKQWLHEFGGLNGLRPTDFIDFGIADFGDMTQFMWPQYNENSINGVFLGQFFEWDGYENYKKASRFGFKANDKPVEGCGYTYENLDNYQTGVHDYFKYIKFGFGRCTDLVCNHIRRKRILRDEGIAFVKAWDGQYPSTYLGKPLAEILGKISVSEPEFRVICERFMNKELFAVKDGVITPKFEVGRNEAD